MIWILMMSKEKTLSILCTILRIAFSIFAIIKSDFRIEINGHWHLQDNKSFAIIALRFSLCCNIFLAKCLIPNYVFWKWSFNRLAKWDTNLGKIMILRNKSNDCSWNMEAMKFHLDMLWYTHNRLIAFENIS